MKERKNTIVTNTNFGFIIFITFLLIITFMFFLSIIDSDKAVSEKENRGLTQFPKLSFHAVFSGEFTEEFEKYYSDQFPFRDKFLSVNEKINKIARQFSSGGDDSIVIVSQGDGGDDFGGESLHDRENKDR